MSETIEVLLGILPLILICSIVLVVAASALLGNLHAGGIIGAVIGVVLIVVLVIPVISGDSESEELPTEWYYDDYVKVDATEATGSLEIVSLPMGDYLHAKGVGSGTYTIDGTTTEVDVQKANLDVVFILGQSNGAYYGASPILQPTKADPVPKIGTSYYYGNDTTPVNVHLSGYTYAMHDMINGYGNAKIGGNELPLAGNYTEATGHKIYVVNGAVGGRSVTAFQVGEDTYEYSQAVWNDAISLIDSDYWNVDVLGYIWIQGEADSTMFAADYYDYFVAMDTALGDGTFSTTTLDTCYMVPVRKSQSPYVYQAQMGMCDTLDDVVLASNVQQTFTGSDWMTGLHYTQIGRNLIMENVAAKIVEVES